MNLFSGVPVAPSTESEPRQHDVVAHKSLNCTSGKTLKLRFLDTTLDLPFQNVMSSSLADSPSSHPLPDGIHPAEEVKIYTPWLRDSTPHDSCPSALLATR